MVNSEVRGGVLSRQGASGAPVSSVGITFPSGLRDFRRRQYARTSSAALPLHLQSARRKVATEGRTRDYATARLAGLIIHAPATIARTNNPGMTASQVPVAAKAPVPAQPIDDSASAKVATRDDVCRCRNRLRRACVRNQNWIAVADPAAMTTPPNAMSAANGAAIASTATNGPKTM